MKAILIFCKRTVFKKIIKKISFTAFNQGCTQTYWVAIAKHERLVYTTWDNFLNCHLCLN